MVPTSPPPSSISRLVQPLLRGAGRDVVLGQLTLAERNLLGSLRSYSQFRQGFYTQVVIGDLGVAGPRRFGAGARVDVARGGGFVGGYLGLLQLLQRVRNTEDNLDLQLRTLSQLEANLEAGLIDLVQVDQFRQNIERERSSLLFDRNDLEQALDDYKTGTLGLPPDLPMELDDGPIEQFQFVARDATRIQDDIAQLQERVGSLAVDAPVDAVAPILTDVESLLDAIREHAGSIESDLDTMDAKLPERERTLSDEERSAFADERAQLRERLATVQRQFELAGERLDQLESGLDPAVATSPVIEGVVVLLGDLLRGVQDAVLVQARARLESVTIQPIELLPEAAYEIALANRLDFMNARAALVDRWRAIQFRADALQSDLNLVARGELGTSGDSAVDFRSPDYAVELGVEFDSPLTRLAERNAYRESLIEYQRSRRAFIESGDALHLGLRALLRDIEQLQTDLEIQRRAVVIAIRRVDLTRAELYAPVRPPQPGQRPAQFGPTAAINLLSALSSLRDTQNSFLGVWIRYYAARLRLQRELGVLRLDDDGRWVETEIPTLDTITADSRGRAPTASGAESGDREDAGTLVREVGRDR